MPKPQKIETNKCRKGLPEEEYYKNQIGLEYWWGLRDLAASFDINYLRSHSGNNASNNQEKEFAYLQILHYSTFINLADAYHQLETMSKLLSSNFNSEDELRLRNFKIKSSFNALHSKLYQSYCAIVNQLFTLLNRTHYTPETYSGKPIYTGLLPRQVIKWLNRSRNKPHDYNFFIQMIKNCNTQLDIRHHFTHYGYVPSLRDNDGAIFIQKNFSTGGILTRFDLKLFLSNNNLVSVLDASQSRLNKISKYIDEIYEYIYIHDVFENYMNDRGLMLVKDYRAYWEGNETEVVDQLGHWEATDSENNNFKNIH